MFQFSQCTLSTLLRQGIALVSLWLASSAGAAEVPFTEAPPALGRLISVGAHKLHLHCLGAGSPTVVLEAGLGGSALEWVEIQASLSQSFRTCSYDRAGMGWSETGPLPRSAEQITLELHTLLQNAREPGPYILIGHSFGGYSAQLFASRFPELSAGLVLIDSSHPEQIKRFASAPVKVNIAPKGKLMHLMPVQVAKRIPGQVRETAAALIMDFKSRKAATEELQSFRLSAKQLMQHAKLPNIPLLVLTRGVQKWPDNDRGNRMEALWQQLQRELAQKSANAAQIIAHRSGHHIHLDQPELVRAAIQLVATSAQQANDTEQQTWLAQGLGSIANRFTGLATVEYATVNHPMLAMSR